MKGPSLIFIASHLGYPMDRTPLGGGAMVGLHLARSWAADGSLRLAALGSGPDAPFTDTAAARYVRLAAVAEGLVDLSELAYARFCRRFERETAEWLLARRAEYPPESTTVVVNDISEGPDLAALKAAGYPIVSIWHVDVVDYFNKLYLKNLVDPSRVTALYETFRRASGLIPDVLKLVFEKQRETVRLSDLMVVPSSAMAETIARCYGRFFDASRVLVQPWGAIGEWRQPDAAKVAALREKFKITDETDVIMTLSRISPEKGLENLVSAVARIEHDLKRDCLMLINGSPAFMMGQAYFRRVKAAAARLKRARVVFPGYVASFDKPEMFALADLFVSPSIHESYGLTIVEALRAGVPVLSMEHYGVRDILKPEYGVTVKSVEEMARRLEELLGDEARLRAMGEAAAHAASGMTFAGAAGALKQASLGLQADPGAVAAAELLLREER